VTLLLGAGANVHAKDMDRETPLHMASRIGKPDIVRALIEGGADKEAKTDDGVRPGDRFD
ncbi:unnamed protein product, partial [Phaeothamnion confervicola]